MRDRPCLISCVFYFDGQQSVVVCSRVAVCRSHGQCGSECVALTEDHRRPGSGQGGEDFGEKAERQVARALGHYHNPTGVKAFGGLSGILVWGGIKLR